MSSNRRFPLDMQILNISSNLTHLSEWAAGDYREKIDLIKGFTDQTEEYLKDLDNQDISPDFQETLRRFTDEFNRLKKVTLNENNKLRWAEKALTWANILQHRAKLA